MAHGIPVRTIVKIAVATVLIAAVAALFLGPLSGLVESLSGERVSAWVNAAGAWGPTVIILLMTVAIVATPIPSAPIALAAGAAYGHTIGTIYIVIGAEHLFYVFVIAFICGAGAPIVTGHISRSSFIQIFCRRRTFPPFCLL